MKFTVVKPVEIEVVFVRIIVPFRYDGEDNSPDADFPLRRKPFVAEREENFRRSKYEVWDATVNIDTGHISGWPIGRTASLNEKICDEGIYILEDFAGNELAVIEGYVPNELIPGEHGDYMNLEINADGVITNWPKKPSVEQFFPSDD